MKLSRSFGGIVGIAIVIIVAVIGIGYLTLLGGNTSEVFDHVDSGLTTGGPGLSAPEAAPVMPVSDMDEQGQAIPQQQIERIIIRNASISLEVDDVRATEDAINTLVEQLGGYVVQIKTNGTGDNLTSNVSFRVPAERFDEVLANLQGMAKRVISRSVSGDDVTEEYVDLQSRLGNLERTRDRLQELMDQAQTVEDTLNVSRELTNVQGQIEQIQGRVEYLEQSAAMSWIQVYLRTEPTKPIVRDASWNPLDVARDALGMLIAFGQFLVNIVIVLVVLLPAWLPLLLLGHWFWRKRRKAATTAPPPPPPQTQS